MQPGCHDADADRRIPPVTRRPSTARGRQPDPGVRRAGGAAAPPAIYNEGMRRLPGSSAALPALAGLVLVALAVQAGSAVDPPRADLELRVGLRQLPDALDPARAGEPPEDLVFHQVFRGLVEVGDRGEIEPGLATRWSVSRDGLAWTFHLRPDGRFHDGSPVTADAVAASLGRSAGGVPGREPPQAWERYLRGPAGVLREVRAVDPRTVEVRLARPFSPLLGLLAHPALAVALPQNGSQVPFVGTGPYRVARREPGRLVLEAVPGERAPRSTRLVFVEVGDDPGALTELGPGGGLDVHLPRRPPAWGAPGLPVVSGPTVQMGYLAFRVTDGLLARKAVRHALAAALDPALVEAALEGQAVPVRGFLPAGAWGAREVPLPPHDPGRARRLLREAGVERASLTLLVREAGAAEGEAPDARRLAEAIRISLAVAGVAVTVRPEPDAAYARALAQGAAELALFGARFDLPDPHFALAPLLASEAAVPGSATNVAFYRNPQADNMLLRASQLAFRPERLRLYHRLQALVADELPYLPLYARLQWAVLRPTVREFRLAPNGRHPLERAWVEAPPASPLPVPPVPGAGGGLSVPEPAGSPR